MTELDQGLQEQDVRSVTEVDRDTDGDDQDRPENRMFDEYLLEKVVRGEELDDQSQYTGDEQVGQDGAQNRKGLLVYILLLLPGICHDLNEHAQIFREFHQYPPDLLYQEICFF